MAMAEIYDDFELEQHVNLVDEMEELGYVAFTSIYSLEEMDVYGAIFVTRTEVAERIAEINAGKYCTWAANLREQGIDPVMFDFERESALPVDYYLPDIRLYHSENMWEALSAAAKIAYQTDPPQF